ncbi:hypothetical protein PINS_up007022 [Pythium insidiosum]|nr:hypothetical protein PINS_up007022 [Pythium insidiosum]
MYDAATDCAICDKKFHAFRRKHRCRSCGNAVCGSCARTHKVLPTTTLMRYHNEPVRVCDRCIRSQNQMMQERRRAEDIERARARQQAAVEEEQRAAAAEQQRQEQLEQEQRMREENRRAMQRRALELKHLGPRPERSVIRRCRSLDDCRRVALSAYQKDIDVFIPDVEERSLEILDMAGVKPSTGVVQTPSATATAMAVDEPTAVPEADECAICLDNMDVGEAIFTTACGHSFHWRCLKEIQASDASNYDKCPSCRTIMEEVQVKRQCDHPRVRLGHRFCRDCGSPVTERDAKPRADEMPPPPPPSVPSGQMPPAPQSYRAGSHGALVRCPSCQIQMRVLPHMYNMRVACPAGHMFLVQVAPQAPGGGPHGMMGGGARTAQPGYPGAYYRSNPSTYAGL